MVTQWRSTSGEPATCRFFVKRVTQVAVPPVASGGLSGCLVQLEIDATNVLWQLAKLRWAAVTDKDGGMLRWSLVQRSHCAVGGLCERSAAIDLLVELPHLIPGWAALYAE